MIRRTLIIFISVFTLLVTTALPGMVHAERNILMIILDDVGVDMIGAYQALEGSTMVPSTPTIDSLAQQGITFRSAWSNPLCATTRATIQTGQYGYRTGVLGPTDMLPLNRLTIAEVFNINNQLPYTQSTFGKWGLGQSSLTHAIESGYDYFSGKSNCCINEGYYAYSKNTAEFLPGAPGSACDPDDPTAHRNPACIASTNPAAAVNYATTENVNDAVDWINNKVPSGQNWFLILNFNASHWPSHAPPGDSATDPDRLWNTFDPNGHFDPDPATNPNRTCYGNTASNQVCYRSAIEAADTEIQRLLDEATIDLNNTTIILLGDNGSVVGMAAPPFNPGRAKGSLYEGGINVPLIIAGDGVSAPDRVSDALVNTTDLFTTVLNLAGIDTSALPPDPNDACGVPQDHDAFSLLPVLSDDCNGGCSVDGIREYAYSEGTGGKTIRNRDGYKLKYNMYSPGNSWEFYYLVDDPYENTNLIVSYDSATGELRTTAALQPVLDNLRALLGNGGQNPTLPAANDPSQADPNGEVCVPDAPKPKVITTTTPVTRGGTLGVSWSGIGSPTAYDWVGVFAVGANATSYLDWVYTGKLEEGSATINLAHPAYTDGASYEVRLYENDGYDLLASGTSFIMNPTAPTVILSSTLTTPDSVIDVAWSGIATPTATDWVGVYEVGANDFAYKDWVYLGGMAAGETTITLAGVSYTVGNAYELRLYANDGFTLLARSDSFTLDPITPAVTVTALPVTMSGGVNTKWTGIETPTATDWIGVYEVGTNDFAYKDWVYLDGLSSGATTINLSHPSLVVGREYELRMYANDGFDLLDKSASFILR